MTDQLDLWQEFPGQGPTYCDPAVREAIRAEVRRFRAVSPKREAELLDEGRQMSRAEAERTQRRYGL